MGRPRTVNKALPKYASAFRDRHGHKRVRLRRTGWTTCYVQSDLATPQFTVEYEDWLENGKIQIGEKRVRKGSFDDLIARYYKTQEFAELKPITQRTYRGEIEKFRKEYGERMVATIQAKHIAVLLKRLATSPAKGNNLRKRLRTLFNLAILEGMRGDNPAMAVAALKSKKKGGYPAWQEEQIAKFEAYHKVGTMERLAFDLALYTAQRISDVRVMGPQHIQNGKLRVKQFKTEKLLKLPILPALHRSIDAAPSGQMAFVVSSKGAPYAEGSFGNWFRKACRKAGCDGYSMHGLRKSASRRMAEGGLSNQLIKSVTGHVTDSEVSRYTEAADQERMAEIAMPSLAISQNSDLATPSQLSKKKAEK